MPSFISEVLSQLAYFGYIGAFILNKKDSFLRINIHYCYIIRPSQTGPYRFIQKKKLTVPINRVFSIQSSMVLKRLKLGRLATRIQIQ